MAIGSMTTNSTVNMIDKTLSIENAPADAKATGDALAGKLGLHDAADNGVVASGNGYIRFGCGTQICWGAVQLPSSITARNTATFSFTFPMAFADANYIKTISQRSDPGGSWNIAVANTSMRTTGFDALIANGDTTTTLNAGAVFEYIAIGRWK